MTEQQLQILYEDEEILVCVKPAGIASQTRRIGEQDMVSLLRNYRVQKGEESYLGLVHRLDQPVEGIMVFGKNQASTAELSRQIATEQFGKIYLAVVQGELSATKGIVEDYLKKDGKNNRSYVVPKKEQGAKKAVLEYQVLQTDVTGKKSLVRIKLHTGRHHQIRVQMANLGAPLLGDGRYGTTGESDRTLALCASELYFKHPKTHQNLSYQINPTGKVLLQFTR